MRAPFKYDPLSEDTKPERNPCSNLSIVDGFVIIIAIRSLPKLAVSTR